MNEESLFAKALEISEVADRHAWLVSACPGDEALRLRIEKLIASHGRPPGILDQGGANDYLRWNFAECHPPISTPAPGNRIGPYLLKEPMGTGGFGMAFAAEQQQPLVRQVALTIIKPGMDSHGIISRR